MGQLTVPARGSVCIDTQILIYTVERHPAYGSLVAPLWDAARSQRISVVASELVALETMVLPLRRRDTTLQADYERALHKTDLKLVPITLPVLMRAASLRADLRTLRTPDAIHAATGLVTGCTQFITNDRRLAGVPGISVIVLDDIAGPTGPA